MRGEQKKQIVQQIDVALLRAIESARDANKLFELAEHYGKFHWLNTTERWACPEVENHIFRLIEPRLPALRASQNRTMVSHVISEGYDVGGHTPLCINLMKEHKKRGTGVQFVITRGVTKKVLMEVQNTQIPILAQNSTGVAKLLFLTEVFLKSKSVVLYINPDDIIACLAAKIAEREGVQCHFVNHADLHFSYGPSQCSTVLEITWASWLTTQKYRSPKGQSFLGIPSGDFSPTEIKDAASANNLPPYFISVGGPHKYQLDQTDVFLKFVEFLCGKMQQKLLLVGPSNQQAFSKLSTTAKSNLELCGIVDRDKTLILMAGAKAYLDSFPEGGGTSVTNAMKLGMPVFGAKSKVGMFGDEYASDSLEDLYCAIENFLLNGPDPEKIRTRATFIDEQLSLSACLDRLANTIDGNHEAIPFSFDIDKIDLTYYQRAWLEQDRLYIPPIIKNRPPTN